MPRLPPKLLWRAHGISPHVATLLPACRDIPTAVVELRWIREESAAAVSLSHDRPLSRLKLGGRGRGQGFDHGGWHRRRHYGQQQQQQREKVVAELCRRRGRGEPLQYVLGTQPFGELEIRCRPGVLIPRPETEAYTIHLAELIRSGSLIPEKRDAVRAARATVTSLRILDLCTGTGCIPLLLYSRLRHQPFPAQQKHLRGQVEVEARPRLEVVGVDISARAVRLARENAAANSFGIGTAEEAAAAHSFPSSSPGRTPPPPTTPENPCEQQPLPRFERMDIFSDAAMAGLLPLDGGDDDGGGHHRGWDVITCNPPYVSEAGFARDTARSVRNFEPRMANVPPPLAKRLHDLHLLAARRRGGVGGDDDVDAYDDYDYSSSRVVNVRDEDVFYARVLHLTAATLRPRVLLFEVGDLAQAVRVVEMALRLRKERSRGSGGSCTGGGGGVRGVEVEIWRDWPDIAPADDEVGHVMVDSDDEVVRVKVKGNGHGRAVLIQFEYERKDTDSDERR